MDDIVKQAMAKWPNVPHCYGWLALDARGGWRMRDEQAQATNSAGDRISNPALLAFINRNYLHDERGCWYFQNGPQRVYVNLEATPYIAHTDPAHGFILHTGELLSHIDAAWLTETGQLVLQSGEKVVLVDDRDMASCLPYLHFDGAAASDEQLLEWLDRVDGTGVLTLRHDGKDIPVECIQRSDLASTFGFIQQPRSNAAQRS